MKLQWRKGLLKFTVMIFFGKVWYWGVLKASKDSKRLKMGFQVLKDVNQLIFFDSFMNLQQHEG